MGLFDWLRGIATEKEGDEDPNMESAIVRLPNGEYWEVGEDGVHES